jgi:Ca-activated chloride channel homolog
MNHSNYRKKRTAKARIAWRAMSILVLVAFGILAGCAKKVKGPTPIPGDRAAAGLTPSFSGGYFQPEPSRTAITATRSTSAVSPDDELWVIARSTSAAQPDDTDTPGTGSLTTKLPGKENEVPLPLKHTDVKASISAYIATVEVTQQFHNPYDGKIEAVYIFPLPHNAAVNEFVMTIGERRIRGIIRERQEAEQIYQEAKSQGYVASLLTQERPNIFTQSVANIEPGKRIDVNIRYFHTLAYVDGWYEFVFPMVVGPRFNPPQSASGVSPESPLNSSPKGRGIGAVPRGQPGLSGQKTEVHYLRPGERSGHDISLNVEVDAGVAIEESACRTHAVIRKAASPERLVVSLDPNDRIPNKDFVLRYRVAGERIKSNLLTHYDERGGYFTLMLYPPRELSELGRQALELVFVLDCSGSMSGRPLAQAKAAIERALQRLQPLDTFQLIRFSNDASTLGPKPLLATPANIRRGLDYLRSLNSEGGTMMIEGVKAALDFPHDPQRLRFVCFLTDGYIGNDPEILGEVHQRLGASRIFSFGVGSSVNRYLLDHMAKLGRGAVAYLGLNDDGAKVMDDFFERISHPAMTDLQIDWGGLQVKEVFPHRVPDLFVGRPVILTGRFGGGDDTPIRIRGKAGAQPVTVEIRPRLNDPAALHRGLPSVWARMKIADLADRSTYEAHAELFDEIRQVALDYGLMSAFTAFVAADSTRRTEGEEGTTVPVAVPVPEGVKYETTVPGEN